MSARFEVAVLGKGKCRIYDEYWDKEMVVSVNDDTPISKLVRVIYEMVDNGDTHRWFAAGVCGHDHIFEIPETAYAIPGRHLRYK